MIKFAPTLIEFGDGDTGYHVGTTDEGYGCIALFNAEPGEIGRTTVGNPPEDKIGAYIVFKNVESLEAVTRNFQKLRDFMVTGSVDTEHPIKRPWVCESCRWHTQNPGCTENYSCDECPHLNDDRHCKCLTVSEGDPCPYFEKFEREEK